MVKILLVDDSDEIGKLVETGLNSYFIRKARSIAEADVALKDLDYDLLLIDVSLPDGNGFDFCMRLNQDPRHAKTPRIFLTGKSETSEKVYGFNCGADDYITKPFHLAELRARVDRYVQRKSSPRAATISHSGFLFDLEFQRCYLNGDQKKVDLGLTPTEFRLFLILAKNPNRVLSRKFLEMTTWETHGAVIEKRGIDTHIAHLRRKLGTEKKCIVSVYGQGYSFSERSKAS